MPIVKWFDGISYMVPKNILDLLEKMAHYHTPTCMHLLRTARLCWHIGMFTQTNALDLMFAGLGHDVGKLEVPLSLLERWDPKQESIMQKHVMAGYHMLQPGLPLIAHIIVRHHRFQLQNPYPAELPPLPKCYCSEEIETFASLVATADCYDAKLRSGLISGREIRLQMYRDRPYQSDLIKKLYRAGIFNENDRA